MSFPKLSYSYFRGDCAVYYIVPSFCSWNEEITEFGTHRHWKLELDF